MAERRATNKYYPPDWDPSKGSINKFLGQHPLRDRARKLDQGILIIRFELPYNIWCDGCNNMIGMGVRYNAEKKKIGMYYTTPIWSFRMKCHLCSSWIEVHTDPKNSEYVIASGAKKKVETWDPKENGTLDFQSDLDKEKLETNPFFKLEHIEEDKQKAKKDSTKLTDLQKLNDRLWADPYRQSRQLRKRFREEKKIRLEEEKEAKFLQDKLSLSVKVLPKSEDDERKAKMIKFDSDRSIDSDDPQFIELKKSSIRNSSIFQTNRKQRESKEKTESTLKALTKPQDPFELSLPKPNTTISNMLSSLIKKSPAKSGFGWKLPSDSEDRAQPSSNKLVLYHSDED
ncbi:hypothetical protein HK098_006440 [Nowakowskiella sp. JEL0407]|nr:hypothetical protein HK098_006440 [Nowakowskiella sp. JEL0407]